eukprot:658620-Rhodomonas_salina.1
MIDLRATLRAKRKSLANDDTQAPDSGGALNDSALVGRSPSHRASSEEQNDLRSAIPNQRNQASASHGALTLPSLDTQEVCGDLRALIARKRQRKSSTDLREEMIRKQPSERRISLSSRLGGVAHIHENEVEA